MKRIIFDKFLKNYWFEIGVFLIILLAIALRFINYQNRWGLAFDQAHDAVIARYSLETKKIPLLGPFSSAGPFQTGGEWYWFIMLGTLFFPGSVLSPWIFLTLLYVVFVFLMIFLGKGLKGKVFGLITGLLAAVSTAQIAQGINLTNQGPEAIFSLFAIGFAILYARKKEAKYLFFLGLSVATAISIHLQGAALGALILVTLLFTGLPKIKTFLALILGLFLPLIPIIIVEFENNFFNARNMLYYYLHDQYRISFEVLGRRWLTYVGVFWPREWALIIGGEAVLGYLLVLSLGAIVIYSLFKKILNKEWFILLISFLMMFILVRYTHTPLFSSYLVFLHPFIFLFTAWVIFFLYQRRKIVGLLFLLIILIGSLYRDIFEIKTNGDTIAMIAQWKNMLIKQFPQRKFALYDYRLKTRDKSMPLCLFLHADKKIDDSGMKVGLRVATSGAEAKHPLILGNKTGYQLLDLTASSSAELSEDNWFFINPSETYYATEDWYKKRQ